MAQKKKITENQSIKGKTIIPTTRDKAEVGIDADNSFMLNLVDAAQVGRVDLSAIANLETQAQTREQMYELIDTMSQDDIISSVLEVYAEDVVETNDQGHVMWCESTDSNVSNYVSFLLDSLNVDKNLYDWTYSLLTYGDLYLKLYRESDYEADEIFGNKNRTLNEDINVVVSKPTDHYVPYVEMMPNPGEMFELTKRGKTMGFVHAPVRVIQQTNDTLYTYLTNYNYQMRQKDVDIYGATDFVHACLQNSAVRKPETVDIFLDDPTKDSKDPNSALYNSYNVKRGQSVLYNTFRIWRELNLLENSALLNRLTKSAVVRILTVDIGDMPKEQVNAFMQRLKDKIEQKTALNTGVGMSEYTSPGPIENTIYIPVHGTQGTIQATTIGGDYDPKSLVDIEYFRDKMFGALKIPKQYFGFTEDGAGFNGGTSLSILSSRYGKTVKRIQNTMCQLVTDLVNLFLIDRGLENYLNKFTIRMQAPITQEELDKRSNNDTRMRYVNDVMTQLNDIEDKAVKLSILKALLSNIVNDPQVIGILQDYITKLETEAEATETPAESSGKEKESSDETLPPIPPMESVEESEDQTTLNEEGSLVEEDFYIPSPADLNLDMTKSTKGTK